MKLIERRSGNRVERKHVKVQWRKAVDTRKVLSKRDEIIPDFQRKGELLDEELNKTCAMENRIAANGIFT